jgi:oligopeptidase B
MQHTQPAFLVALLVASLGCRSAALDTAPVAPLAEVVPTHLETHGHVRTDDYYWMRQRDDPRVIAYLEAENAYVRAMLAPTEGLQAELYAEMVGRVKQDDSTVPVQRGDYGYYTRFEDGRPYPLHCRERDGHEQVLLDLNALSAGHGYYAIASRAPSPDHGRLAYAVDTVGRRIYTIEVKDLATGAVSDRLPGASSNVVWAEDGRHIFYAKRDLETLRTYQIWRHELGTDPARDALVFEEADEEFSCSVSKTRSRRFLEIRSRQTLTSEVRLLEADRPLGEWRVVLPRERGHEYSVEHHGDDLILRTNKNAPNFRVVRAPLTDPTRWTELVSHRPDVLIEDVDAFARQLVITQRRAGLRQLVVLDPAGTGAHEVEFDDPAYSLRLDQNPEFDTTELRFAYSSLRSPPQVIDYDLETRARTVRKTDEVRGFDKTEYASERRWATASDGTRVPISLVYKHPFTRDGSRPLLLYGYGSYGASMDAGFNPNIVSLLDRGYTYAIAHVRGGQELGRQWYEDGKLLAKRNTFTDFIACGEHLVAEGYTAPERMCAMGGSAGGLLMGAVVNMRPDLFRAVVAAVPFVDVVTTMLDASVPLTTFEWDEWGNPANEEYYAYMLSYSPYDQVRAQGYPHLLVTTGLHDSQVQYWEPAKWVAKLRRMKTDDNLLLFKTEMEAGHGGASGRYERYKNQALTYAFLLHALE